MSVSPAVSIKSAKSSFQWDDPFLITDQLTEEERMIADAAKAFAEALGEKDAAIKLDEATEDIYGCDDYMSEIAERSVNLEAVE